MKLKVLSTGPKELARELDSTPGVGALRAACRAEPVIPTYLVGGAVRDLLSGRPRGELDVATEGGVELLAERLGGAEISHGRFGTASLELEGIRVDLAQTRSETYPRPGALPEVEPAPVDADLGRRDFTVNAMAIPLHDEEPRLIDHHGGLSDLKQGLLRVLHDGSFEDDPTRVIRAARYVARLGMQLEDSTQKLAAAVDLGTVSSDRVEAELSRLAVEPNPERGFALLADLGIGFFAPGAVDRVAAVGRLLADPTWSALADPARAIVAAAKGEGLEVAQALAAAAAPMPSEGVGLAAHAEPAEVVLGRALGAGWLDRWLTEWRGVTLEISGDDLIAAGVEPGPAIGHGLAAALKAKLDGEVSGREAELEVALRAARAA